MKKTLILIAILFLFSSCATTFRYYRNYEIWYPGKVAQHNQLKGKMGNGCEINQKRIFRSRY